MHVARRLTSAHGHGHGDVGAGVEDEEGVIGDAEAVGLGGVLLASAEVQKECPLLRRTTRTSSFGR